MRKMNKNKIFQIEQIFLKADLFFNSFVYVLKLLLIFSKYLEIKHLSLN